MTKNEKFIGNGVTELCRDIPESQQQFFVSSSLTHVCISKKIKEQSLCKSPTDVCCKRKPSIYQKFCTLTLKIGILKLNVVTRISTVEVLASKWKWASFWQELNFRLSMRGFFYKFRDFGGVYLSRNSVLDLDKFLSDRHQIFTFSASIPEH